MEWFTEYYSFNNFKSFSSHLRFFRVSLVSKRWTIGVLTFTGLWVDDDRWNNDGLNCEEDEGAQHDPDRIGGQVTDGVKEPQVLPSILQTFLSTKTPYTRSYTIHSSDHWTDINIKRVKLTSYTEHYPILRIAQSTLHFTALQTCSIEYQLGFCEWRPAALQLMLKHYSYINITAVSSQVLVHTVEWTGAMCGEINSVMFARQHKCKSEFSWSRIRSSSHCAIAPLRHCAIAPLRHCATAPLRHWVPLCHCATI